MKFTLNGALTVGTLDGANVEIREAVGEENFFLFGLDADEVERVKREGYRPGGYIEANADLGEALRLIGSGRFSRGDGSVFHCSYANECSEVCPKHVDPAAAVNQAKFNALLDWARGFVVPRRAGPGRPEEA